MNKNYRNALLIAAISTLAACAGDTAQTGEGESPLNDPNFDVGVLANGDAEALLVHREIASLLGGVFQTILGTTSEVSKSTILMTDSSTGIGKVVGGAIDAPASVSGISVAPGPQPCTNGGTFELNAKYEYINDEGQAATPEDFVTFGDYEVTTSISTIYSECNEPARSGYDVNDQPILEEDEAGNVVDRILDGAFGLAFNSNPVEGAGGTNGFEFTADLQLTNYSIQEGANTPRMMDANISFTLQTEDANGDVYRSTISGDIVSQNEDGNSFTKTTLLADGELEIDFDSYALFLDGSIVDYSMISNPFNFYSETTLTRNGANDPVVDGIPVPSSGTLVIRQGDVTGVATVINNGNQLEVTTTDANGVVTVEVQEWCDLLGC